MPLPLADITSDRNTCERVVLQAWTDITKGTNAIGRGGGMSLPYGYNCTKGWDPATGLGTPLFDKMLAAALK